MPTVTDGESKVFPYIYLTWRGGRLARHLVSLYYPEEVNADQGSQLLPQDFMKDYIYYCRYHGW